MQGSRVLPGLRGLPGARRREGPQRDPSLEPPEPATCCPWETSVCRNQICLQAKQKASAAGHFSSAAVTKRKLNELYEQYLIW